MDTNFQPIIPSNMRDHYRQHPPLEFKRALALSLELGASVVRDDRPAGGKRPAGDTTPAAVWFAYTPDRKGMYPLVTARICTGMDASAIAPAEHDVET